MISEITKCRICGNQNLVSGAEPGEPGLTGVFPRNKGQAITSGPLELVKCQAVAGERSAACCSSGTPIELDEMYGENYGYRSGLNRSMVEHLHGKVRSILERAGPAGSRATSSSTSAATTARCCRPTPRTRACTWSASIPRASSSGSTTRRTSSSIPDFFSAEAVAQRVRRQARPRSSRRSRCSTTWRSRWSSCDSARRPGRRRHLDLRAELHADDAAR